MDNALEELIELGAALPSRGPHEIGLAELVAQQRVGDELRARDRLVLGLLRRTLIDEPEDRARGKQQGYAGVGGDPQRQSLGLAGHSSPHIGKKRPPNEGSSAP